ncbi:hypothetical protein HA402_012763 [Bradysia odoriphaga]|nr:hypothetical protein HA402_012763 [Bradysia odoriphaga]
MSRGLTNSSSGFRALRDYGSTSTVPEVNFAGFSPTEFMSLSESIAQNIGSVKSSWQHLEKAIKIIGTARDNLSTREKVHQIQSTTNGKIQTTSKDLQRLTVVVRHGDKQQRLQVEKLTSDFKNVVEMYSSSQKQIAAKMKAIFLTNASQNDDIHRDSMNGNENDRQQQLQKQKMLRENLEFEQGMLVEREHRVQQIEADVLDVNEIMRDLATLINQQGEQIDSIESGIDHAAGEVEAGTSELIKAAQSQAKYRRKVLILLAIAVIIGLIVTGIIVSALKS